MTIHPTICGFVSKYKCAVAGMERYGLDDSSCIMTSDTVNRFPTFIKHGWGKI